MDARHRADEVAVRDVGQRVEMRLMPSRRRDLSSTTMPLSGFSLVRSSVGVLELDAPALERPCPVPERVSLRVPARVRLLDVGQRRRVPDLLCAAAVLADEADGRREDAVALLPRLHRPRRKRPPVAHPLDVVHDGDRRRPGQQEIAVARVHQEVVLNRQLGGGQTLSNHSAAVDTSSAGGQPQRPCVGEDVLLVDGRLVS